jgi:molybdopterin synthase catalytic subunit
MTIDVHIIDGPLAMPAPTWPLQAPAGAVAAFEGLVRPAEQGEPIAGLDYEVYQPMAEQMLRRFAGQIVERHGLLAISVEHSCGRVPVGACSFRLRLAAEHSKPCIAAMAEFLDRLKTDVPIWKAAYKDHG